LGPRLGYDLQRAVVFKARRTRTKIFCPKGLAQPLEKAHFRQGNPRKSKPKILLDFARLSPGLAGFG
jgi:hypothetical protein